MTAFQPTGNGLEISIILEMIAVNGVFGPFDDCLSDEVGSFEVHVSHPHRQHIRIAEHLSAQVVFHAVGVSAIDDFVEIVFHCRMSLMPQSCEFFRCFCL